MTTPFIYQGLIPTQTEGGLTPMQLALAQLWITGQQPFSVNVDFLTEMNRYASSELQTPLDTDPRTGLTKQPDLVRDITGIAYFVRGEDIYLYRRAQDCAMDEQRYEEVWLGKVDDIAKGTYAYYGRMIRSGSISTGGGGGDGGGGNYNYYNDDGFYGLRADPFSADTAGVSVNSETGAVSVNYSITPTVDGHPGSPGLYSGGGLSLSYGEVSVSSDGSGDGSGGDSPG